MDDWFNWGSVDVSDPGAEYWNMEPIPQTWDDSYDYNYDMPSYDYDYGYDPYSYDYASYDPYYDEYAYGTPGYNGDYEYSDYDGYGGDNGVDYSQPQYGDYSGGEQAGPPSPYPEYGDYSGGEQAGPPSPYPAQQPRQPGYGQPQQPGYGQQPRQGGGGILDTIFGGGSGGGGRGGSLMDNLFPMLLAGGAGYLLSNLIGSKSGGGAAPGGSIGAFGVNQAALQPTTPLNIPTGGTRASSQPAWGSAGAPSATSLGFKEPGTSTLGQLAVGGGMTAPRMLPAPQMMSAPQMLTAPQGVQAMTQPTTPQAVSAPVNLPRLGTPASDIGFQTETMAQPAAVPFKPVAPMDINNVNFGTPNVAGYTPPAGAPVAPNQINDFLRSLTG